MNTDMKRYIKSIMLMAAVALGFSSCEDYPDAFVLADGVPTVHYVRYADNDQLIEKAYMGEIICFVGDNLCSIRELWFNDQQAILNTSLMTEHTLMVAIPNKLAEVETNKAYMITKGQDTVAVDFEVMLPVPVIKSLSCEFQPAGEEVTITGDYFVEPITIEFVNTTVTDIKSLSMTEIRFVIPEGTAPGKIKVTTPSGTSASPFKYFEDRGIMFDFDDDGDAALATNASNLWHPREFFSEGGVDGTYVQLGDGATALDEAGGWNDGLYAFEFWCGSWDNPQNITSGPGIALYNLADLSNPSSMSFKFEMCIPSDKPWKAGAMHICFQPVSQVTVSGNPIEGEKKVAGANAYAFNNEANDLGSWGRALYRPWEATGEFHTDGKWITVTIPITEFNKGYQNGPATSSPSTEKDFASLTMFVVGGGVNGAECAPIIKIDNIRVVPNK